MVNVDRVTHAARYMRLTKGDKGQAQSTKFGAIHFGNLFTLGLLHFARYMRLTKGDKVKHMVLSVEDSAAPFFTVCFKKTSPIDFFWVGQWGIAQIGVEGWVEVETCEHVLVLYHQVFSP